MEVFRRREIKFLLTQPQRAVLEAELARRMLPDRFPHSSICNIYYDTPDFRLIRRSLEHPVYKEKIRLRSYGEVGAVFLEMKKKFDGIVYKRRMALPEEAAMEFMAGRAALPNTQIARELTYFRDFYQNLQPQVVLRYERDSWRGAEGLGLRVTLDDRVFYRMENFCFCALPQDRSILDADLSLLEVKAENAIPMWLVQLLTELKIRKISYSKYGRVYERELCEKLKEKRGRLYVG